MQGCDIFLYFTACSYIIQTSFCCDTLICSCMFIQLFVDRINLKIGHQIINLNIRAIVHRVINLKMCEFAHPVINLSLEDIRLQVVMARSIYIYIYIYGYVNLFNHERYSICVDINFMTSVIIFIFGIYL
jgi:hypothetical protein